MKFWACLVVSVLFIGWVSAEDPVNETAAKSAKLKETLNTLFASFVKSDPGNGSIMKDTLISTALENLETNVMVDFVGILQEMKDQLPAEMEPLLKSLNETLQEVSVDEIKIALQELLKDNPAGALVRRKRAEPDTKGGGESEAEGKPEDKVPEVQQSTNPTLVTKVL